jgi:hypothetical protein
LITAATPAPLPTTPPTSTPTPSLEATPTTDATAQPATANPGTPGPSPAGVENYGAHIPRVNDSFDDPNSGWGVGTNEGGSVAYADGALEIETAAGHAWEWTRVLTGATDNAVNVETVWTPTGTGFYGLLCAASDDELWGAVESSDGRYEFIKVDGTGAAVLQQGQLDSLKLPTGEFGGTSRFALDCAGTAAIDDGIFKMQLNAPGTNEGIQYFAAPGEGPASFDRVGIYTESGDDPSTLSVDYVIAFGGDGNTAPSPDAVELMTHVPADWQPDCFDSFASVHAQGWQADILCQLSGGRSEYAEYTSFDTKTDMDAYFDYLVGKYGVAESGLNCDAGAHLGGYSVGGVEAGRILCAPDPLGGTRLEWTDDSLLILSELIDHQGSYADMYADWLIAGPNG